MNVNYLGVPDPEDAITLAEAAKQISTKPSPETVKRWITHGCRGVRLSGWKIGGRWVTTAPALAEFMRETTTRAMPTGMRTPAQADAAARAAVERLRAEYGRGRKRKSSDKSK